MNIFNISFFLFLLIALQPAIAQTPVILDADIDSDVDDVEALAMLHHLADEKKINFLGVVVTSDDPYAALCTDVINNYYNRPKLPIGVLKDQPKKVNHSKYTRQLSEEYPHRLKSLDKAKDATALYRKLLSKSPDSSVVIVTIGHLSNLQNLLKSGPDRFSSLSGQELVNKKVSKWLCMGGMFPKGKEANFYRPDPASTLYCLEHWKKPVTFAGWEVGNLIHTGGAYLKSKITPANPVYRAYELYNNFYGRPSWDQVAVFLLTDQAADYFSSVDGGYCKVFADGSNEWVPGKRTHHQYVKLKSAAEAKEVGRLMDDMVKQRKK